jgi:squalene-associated FAD-dependent desaturase
VVADVLVIGGGFAGLSAATLLAEHGARVELLEARPTLGGRASAFTDPATSERVDNGQHVIFGCYHQTFAFLRRIGTDGRVHLQRNLTIHVVDREGRASRLACPPLPAPLHLLAGLARWPALGWRDRLSVFGVASALRRGRAACDEQMTVREWLTSARQTGRLIELLWEPLAVAALNQPIDAAAAAPFVEVLRRMFGTGRRDSAVGVPLVPLDELYASPSKQYIEHRGGTVRTSEAGRVLGRDRSGMWCVRTRAGEQQARTVICAMAWHAIPDTLPELADLADILGAARATPPSPIVTVNLWFDGPVAPGAFVGLPGRHMQWVFDKARLFGAGASHLSLVSSGADALAARGNQELIDVALAEVREALPAARAAALTRAVVVRERRATFSLAPGMPRRPGTDTGVPGLLLAGDWVDTGLPATIESAVVSGHAAARAALARLGAPPTSS